MKHTVTSDHKHYCAECKRAIDPKTPHYFYRAEGLRYHVRCDPDTLIAQVVDAPATLPPNGKGQAA